jgi:hypothetical protein
MISIKNIFKPTLTSNIFYLLPLLSKSHKSVKSTFIFIFLYSSIYHLFTRPVKNIFFLADFSLSILSGMNLIYLAITKKTKLNYKTFLYTSLYFVPLLSAWNKKDKDYELIHPWVHVFGGLLGTEMHPNTNNNKLNKKTNNGKLTKYFKR